MATGASPSTPSAASCGVGWSRGSSSTRSPDPHALLWSAIHLVARLDLERAIERIEVRQRAVAAEFVGRVLIRLEIHDQLLGTDLFPPPLRVAQEQALVAREAVDDRRFAAVQRQPVRLVGDLEA